MLFAKNCIANYAAKGISVRYYPEVNYDDFYKRIWQKQYDYSYFYNKDHVRGCKAVIEGRCNEVFESVEALEKNSKEFADFSVKRACDPYEYDMLYIEYDDKLIMQKVSVKSKEITEEYIQKLIDKNEKAYSGIYGNFAIKMQKLLKRNNISGQFSIYPTTYGIGIFRLYNFGLKNDIERVTKILDEHNIEYYNELSDKVWVYRFKISKKAENLNRI